jgi:hypothetical protein
VQDNGSGWVSVRLNPASLYPRFSQGSILLIDFITNIMSAGFKRCEGGLSAAHEWVQNNLILE